MAWKRTDHPRCNVLSIRVSDRDRDRINAAAGSRSRTEIMQEALDLWLQSQGAWAPQICSWCKKQIGEVFYSRDDIEQLPEADRKDLTSHGCCPSCRDAALAADAA